MTFMLRNPLRRDLATVNYQDMEQPNTLDTQSQKMTFTKYKTARFYGDRTYQLTRDQWKLFSWLRKQHKMRGITDGHLLRNTYWRPLTPNALTAYMGAQCRCLPSCEHKKMGCCLLRHIVISYLKRNEMTMAQRTTMAHSMMHSVRQQEMYRV